MSELGKKKKCETCKNTVTVYCEYSSSQCFDCIVAEEEFEFVDLADGKKYTTPRKITWAEYLCWGKRKQKKPELETDYEI